MGIHEMQRVAIHPDESFMRICSNLWARESRHNLLERRVRGNRHDAYCARTRACAAHCDRAPVIEIQMWIIRRVKVQQRCLQRGDVAARPLAQVSATGVLADSAVQTHDCSDRTSQLQRHCYDRSVAHANDADRRVRNIGLAQHAGCYEVVISDHSIQIFTTEPVDRIGCSARAHSRNHVTVRREVFAHHALGLH